MGQERAVQAAGGPRAGDGVSRRVCGILILLQLMRIDMRAANEKHSEAHHVLPVCKAGAACRSKRLRGRVGRVVRSRSNATATLHRHQRPPRWLRVCTRQIHQPTCFFSCFDWAREPRSRALNVSSPHTLLSHAITIALSLCAISGASVVAQCAGEPSGRETNATAPSGIRNRAFQGPCSSWVPPASWPWATACPSEPRCSGPTPGQPPRRRFLCLR